MSHDFSKQKKETFWVWADSQGRHEETPNKIGLDLQFIPIEDNRQTQELKQALQNLGYVVSFYRDDDTLEATIKSIENSAESIWCHEEKTTKIALVHGYKPDGWGYFIS